MPLISKVVFSSVKTPQLQKVEVVCFSVSIIFPIFIIFQDGTDNIDDDLGKILQKITVNTSLEESGSGGRGDLGGEGKQRPPRHLVYAQHFPLPQDDAYMHEINQVTGHCDQTKCSH